MPELRLSPPSSDEFAPFYGRYIEAVRDADDVIALLRRQPAALRSAAAGLSDAAALARYADGKWSVKEVIGHISDTERIFSYRLLRIARGDTTPLPSFDQDAYIATGGFDRRPLPQLLAEFEAVRASTLALLTSLGAEALMRRGTASTYEVTARAIVYMIAGHARHHLEILRERYGVDIDI